MHQDAPANRRFNTRFFLCSIVVVGILAVLAHWFHHRQLARHMHAFKDQASYAEDNKNIALAANWLHQYLQLVPDDYVTQERYARLLIKENTSPSMTRALEVMGFVLQREPDRPALRLDLARLLLRTGQYRQAREQLIRLAEAHHTNGEVDWLLAQCDLRENRYEQAAKHLEEALKDGYDGPPNSMAGMSEGVSGADAKDDDPPVACRWQLAWILRKQLKKANDGDACINKLVSQNPNSCAAHVAAYRYWADVPGDAGRSKARDALKKAAKLKPRDASVLLALAQMHIHDVHLKEARTVLQAAIQAHPEEPEFYRLLASLDIRAGKLKDAAKHLWQLRDNQPRSKVADITTLAEVLVELGRIHGDHSANSVVEPLAEMDFPADALSYLKALILSREKKWAQACQTLRDNESKNQSDPSLAFKRALLLGECQQQLGHLDQAIAAYQRAVDTDSTATQAREALARALAEAGRLDDALGSLPNLKQAGRADRLFRVQLLIQHNLEQPEAGRRWDLIDELLNQLDQQKANDTAVTLLRANALFARDSRNADAVRAMLKTACQKHPRELDLWLARVRLEEQQGKADQADHLLTEAHHEAGDSVSWRLAKAAFILQHGQRGQIAQALEALEKGQDHFSVDEQTRLLEGLTVDHAAAGDGAQTHRLVGELMKRRPTDVSLHARLFDLAMQAGQVDDARLVASQLRQLEGDQGDFWRLADAILLLKRARQGDQNALAEARQREQQLQTRRPGWSRVVLLQAEIAELDHQPDQAIESYQEAVRLGERTPHVFRRLVSLLIERGQAQKADAILQKLPETALVSAHLGRIAAQVALQFNRADEATRRAELAVSPTSTDYRDQLWLGRVYNSAGRVKDAEACFRAAVRLGPHQAEPRIALVVFLSQTHQKDAAQKAIDQAGRDLAPADAPLVLAQCCEAVGDSAGAIRHYEQARKARPNNAQVLHLMASFYINHAGLAEAEPLLRSLIDPRIAAPEAEAAWARRWLAMISARQPTQRALDEALALLSKNVKAGGESIENVRTRATVLATRPWEREEAIKLFEKAEEKGALPAREQLLLASLYQADQKWDDADRCLAGVLSRDPTNVQARALYTRNMLKQGYPKTALERLARLAEVAPDGFETTELKARILRKQKQGEGKQKQGEAVSALLLGRAANHPSERAALAELLEELDQPRSAEPLYRAEFAQTGQPAEMLALAANLGRQNHAREALDLCERAWRTGNPLAVASTSLLILSQAACGAGDYRRVATWLEQARAAHPELVPLTTALANVRALQGDYQQAEHLFREVVQKQPDDSNALNNLAWLLAVKRQRPTEGLSLIQAAINLAGPQMELLDTRATIWLALNNPENAIKDLRAALKQKSTLELQYHLALAESAANRRQQAGQALAEAKKLGLSSPLKLSPFERDGYLQFLSQFDKPKN